MLSRAASIHGARALPRISAASKRARAQRLRQDQDVAGSCPALAQDAVWIDRAIDREAERQFRPFRAMPASEHGAGVLEHVEPAAQDLEQILLDLVLGAIRHGGDGQRARRLAAHGIDVAERVIGGDAAEQVGIVDERAEEVDGLDQHAVARGRGEDGGIVGGIEPDQQTAVSLWRQPMQDTREGIAADLGAATAAAHRRRRRARPADPLPLRAAAVCGRRHVGQVSDRAASSAGRSCPSDARAPRPRPPNGRARRRHSGRPC